MIRTTLVGLALAFIATVASSQPHAGVGTFVGTVDDPRSDMVYVSYHRSHADRAVRLETTDSVRTDIDGRFALDIAIDRPTMFAIKSGRDYITYQKVIRPGDTVAIHFVVTDSVSTLEMGGSAEIANDFLFALDDTLYGDSATRAQHNNSFRLEQNEFVRMLDARRALQLRLFDEYCATRDVPADLREYITSEIDYQWGVDRLQYLWKYKRSKGVQRGQLEVDSSYLAPMQFLATSPIMPGTGGAVVHYLRELITGAYELEFQRARESGASVSDSLQYPAKIAIARRMLHGEARDIATAVMIFEHEMMHQRFNAADARQLARGFQRTDSLIAAFAQEATSPLYHERLRTAIARMRTLSPGKPAPPFTLRDVHGKQVSLADLRGSNVYLEFWSTSCAPCIAELPKTLELQKKLAKENVRFVYISLDGNESIWKRFIDRRRFTGTHLLGDNGHESPVAAAYFVTGIPRYFLIDRDGLIVSSDAPRPSGGAEQMIRSLISRK